MVLFLLKFSFCEVKILALGRRALSHTDAPASPSRDGFPYGLLAGSTDPGADRCSVTLDRLLRFCLSFPQRHDGDAPRRVAQRLKDKGKMLRTSQEYVSTR